MTWIIFLLLPFFRALRKYTEKWQLNILNYHASACGLKAKISSILAPKVRHNPWKSDDNCGWDGPWCETLRNGGGGRLFVIDVDEQYSMSFHASEFGIHNGVNEPLFLFKLTNVETTDHVWNLFASCGRNYWEPLNLCLISFQFSQWQSCPIVAQISWKSPAYRQLRFVRSYCELSLLKDLHLVDMRILKYDVFSIFL